MREPNDVHELMAVVWYPGFFVHGTPVDIRVYDDGTLIEKRYGLPTCVLLPKSAVAELERILSDHRADELLAVQSQKLLSQDGPHLSMRWRERYGFIEDLTPELRSLACALDNFFITWLGERNHLSPFTRKSTRCAPD